MNINQMNILQFVNNKRIENPNNYSCYFMRRCILQFYQLMGKHGDDDESQEYSQDQNQQQKKQIKKPKVDRIDKFKNLKKIVINVSMTQYPVVSQVADALKWKIQQSNDSGDWDIYWMDFAIDTDVLIKMHLFQKINHYPGMHVIARKNLLGINLMGLRNKFPNQYNFFPLTWMLPMQYAEFRAYYETKQKGKARTYIAKPEHECQGRGIFLTRKIQDLQTGKHYVVQRYLARPFLIQGLKFDLRIYVLLCGTNPLRLYMYNQGLARFATEPYAQPTTSNLERQYVHLTNYAINKNNPKFIFNNSSNNMGIGHKRSITCVYKQLAGMGINTEQLKAKINDVAIKTIICGLPLMSHQYKCSQPEDYSGNMCFQILGLDIMLNNKGQPILLEVNHTPSFTTDTPLDYQIKFNLIKDTLKLMNINSKTKAELFNKAKDLNKDRLITGKRQIFQGKERQMAIKQAQALRDEYQDKHLGGFQRIFPIKDQQQMKKYNEIIQSASKTYLQQNGSIRMKMLEKEAKKLAKQDYKQMKSSKIASTQKERQSASQIANDNANLRVKSLKNDINNNEKKKATQENKQFQIDQRQQQQSCDENEQLTRSQNNIQRENQLINNAEFGVPNLIKKYSDKNQNKSINSNQVISHYKKNQPTTTTQNHQDKQSKTNHYPKSTSIRKVNIKDQAAIEKIQILRKPTPKERIKSITVAKNQSKKQNLHQYQNNEFPNIIDYLNNDPSPVMPTRKDQKLHSLSRHQNLRVINRSGKISDYVARDIRDLIEKKVNNNGNFVMPKLMNLNVQNEKKVAEYPQNFLLPLRKVNIFHQNQ